MVALEQPASDPHTILDLLPHGVLVVGADWRVLYANPEAERMIGKAGTTLWERCPDLEHTAFASGFRYAMADHTELLTESALPTVGWVQARALPMPQGLLISLRRVHAGTIETGQARQALLIGELGDALTREDKLDKALERCARAMLRHLDGALARIWTTDDAEHSPSVRRELVLCASAGLAVVDRVTVRFGETRIGQIAEDGAPYLTNELASDPNLASDWVHAAGLISFAGYPLRIEDRIVGVMELYSRRLIGHDVLNSLSAVADALALGIDRKRAAAWRLRAEAKLRAQAEQLEVLHELGKQLAAELDVEALAHQITTAATRLASAQRLTFFYNLVTRSDGQLRFAACGTRDDGFAQLLPRIVAGAPNRVIRIADTRAHDSPYAVAPGRSFLAVPVYGRQGRAIGALMLADEREGVFDEDTERMIAGVASIAAIALDNARLFQEARELIGALEKSNRELDQFAYVASHDLKAPLRGIANLAQWIEDDLGESLSDESRHHLELLRGRVVRLEYLIAGILAYSRATRAAGAREPVALGPLVAETWELLDPPDTAHLAIAADLPTVFGQRTQLEQVFMNLLGNAIKYNPGRELQVSVGARAIPSAYEIFVNDDGVGIAPDFHEKIWGLFQTLERRDKLESTGIGLSIVRKIVDAQGGHAWVESAPGQGATFYFTWPAEQDGEDSHG